MFIVLWITHSVIILSCNKKLYVLSMNRQNTLFLRQQIEILPVEIHHMTGCNTIWTRTQRRTGHTCNRPMMDARVGPKTLSDSARRSVLSTNWLLLFVKIHRFILIFENISCKNKKQGINQRAFWRKHMSPDIRHLLVYLHICAYNL